jgi:dTMP kinase
MSPITPKLAKNWFFVIEALDAGGSQTQTDLLAKHLKKEKYNVLKLHFPQEDRATGQLIYEKFLHHKNHNPFSRREQALLYIQDFFSRNEDITNVLNQKRGRHAVVSDRYCTSTMAYQTIGLPGKERKKMLDWLTWLCWEGETRLHKPDLVIFLDTPVEVSLKRIQLQGKKDDFFETKQKLTAIRNSYLKIAQEQSWHVINSVDKKGTERTRKDLHCQIWQLLTISTS